MGGPAAQETGQGSTVEGGPAAPVRGHLPRRGADGGDVGPGGRGGAGLGRPGQRRARSGGAVAGVQPRRRDQGDRGRRAGRTPRWFSAHRGRTGVGDGDQLHPDAAVSGAPQRHRRAAGLAGAAPARPAPAGTSLLGRGSRRRRRRCPLTQRRRRPLTQRRRRPPTCVGDDATRDATAARVSGMTHQVYAFEPPERFVAGTVGPPGERTFFLQARGGGRLVTVALEKVQVALLAEKLDELLVEAHRRFGVELPPTETAPTDNEPLDTPLDEEFRVGTLGLAFDVDTATVVIEAIAVGEGEAEEEEDEDEDDEVAADRDRLRVRLTPQAARAFIERARKVVASGRPPCPLCGQPLDAKGHLCPRHNGYRR